MNEEHYVVVVGGMNMDIAGLCGDVYREKDSNIGNIQMTLGGVGQNIAQNLTKLDVPTYFIGVYGDDYFGQILVEECRKQNIRLDHAACIAGAKSSSYLYITDEKGEMVSAINDMKITESLTPAFLQQRIDFINHADICVIDANIPQDSLEWLAAHCTAPLFADPVSIMKVGRLEHILDRLDTFKPNELEAGYLTGIDIVDEWTAMKAAQTLIQKGVKHVFLSMGANGMLCADKDEIVKIDILKTKIASVNGAGDCSMATIIWSRFAHPEGLPLKRIGQLAQAASSLTVEVPQSVCPYLSVDRILERSKSYQSEVEK